MDNYFLHFDGSCWPNPGGTAAYGYVLTKPIGGLVWDGHAIVDSSEKMSNNVAEFAGMTAGLQAFLDLKLKGALTVFGDSQLVIKVMSGMWSAKPDKLYYPYFVHAEKVLRQVYAAGSNVAFKWIPREENTRCDDLSKAHLQDSAIL